MPPDLAAVAAAWPELPPAVRAELLGLARGALLVVRAAAGGRAPARRGQPDDGQPDDGQPDDGQPDDGGGDAAGT